MPQEAVVQFLNRITQITADQSRTARGFALEYLEMNEDELRQMLQGLRSSSWVPARGASVPRPEPPVGSSEKGSANRAAAVRKILDRITFAG